MRGIFFLSPCLGLHKSGQMNSLLLRIVFCASLALVAAHPNNANAQNQQEMNQQALRDFEKADRTLNEIYKQLMGMLDEEAQGKLKVVQRAWVQFRDAQAEFQADAEARGGSMAPLLFNRARTRLTNARIKELVTVLEENAN